jgi:hypothetical protein
MTEHWTRREVVKNLGKLGAMSALGLSPIAGFAKAADALPCRPFSIVLHGLFLLDVFSGDGNENYIRISTPDVTGHSYLAGPWSLHVSDYTPVKGFHDQRWDSHVDILPPPGGMPILDARVGDPNHDSAYLSFLVPYPTAIHPFRCFDESEVDYPKDYISASKFPLVLALEYDYLPNLPPIENTSLDRTRNYHVFAEPPNDIPKCSDVIQHGMDAIGKVWKMLPHAPNSIPVPKDKNNCKKGIDHTAPWPCNNRVEEGGLSELPTLEKNPLRSVNLPLCANFIVL